MKAMKAMKGATAMSKGALAQAVADGKEVKKSGQVHNPWTVHDQDARETRDQGRQAGDLRQDGGGEGEASQDNRQGLRGGGLEKVDLSRAVALCPVFCSIAVWGGRLWETHRKSLIG